MLLPAGGIGLVHHDSGEAYYINNISITLNVNSGGSPMIFLCEDQQYSVETDPAFLFQDCCLHGVPKVSSNRLQVRINGRPKKELIESLLDLDSIVK
jgi:hypothetical protein